MLCESRTDGLGALCRYGCFVDSVGVIFVYFSFMSNFSSFRIRHIFYIRDSLFLTLIQRIVSDRLKIIRYAFLTNQKAF